MKIKSAIAGIACLASLPFITGGAAWEVPSCDAPAVLESAVTKASIQFNRSEKNIKFKGIRDIKLKSGKSRTCLAELVDKRTGRYVDDFYYQILITHDISWVLTDLN